MLTIIPGAFHVLMGGLMYLYRITDAYYNQFKGQIVEEVPDPSDEQRAHLLGPSTTECLP